MEDYIKKLHHNDIKYTNVLQWNNEEFSKFKDLKLNENVIYFLNMLVNKGNLRIVDKKNRVLLLSELDKKIIYEHFTNSFFEYLEDAYK